MTDPDVLAVERLDISSAPSGRPAREDGRGVYLTIWWRDIPLGADELSEHSVPARVFADRIGHAAAGAIGERLLGRGFEGADPHAGLPAPEHVPDLERLLALDRPVERLGDTDERSAALRLPAVTLAICTRNRPDQLERCLASVATAQPAPQQVLVVDNGPSEATRAVAKTFAAVEYLPESRHGLSAARNAAIAAARHEILAFIDDDTEVEPRWLERLCAPFADPQVMATTGLVLPAELDTPSQVRFEKVLGGFARGFQPLTYGPQFFRSTRRRAAPVWKIGAGANMALRVEAFRRVGVYDERLGAGASGCSEDSELWYRLLAEGWTCQYEPSSVVHHHHRGSDDAFRRQAHEYIRGHVSALFAQYGRYGDRGNLRRALLHVPRWQLGQARREAFKRAGATLKLMPPVLERPVAAELFGYVRGLRYLPLAFAGKGGGRKAPLRRFLAANPYPRPLTEGFFYREKMRAIHRVAPDTAVADVLEVGGGRSGMARLLYPDARVTVLDADPAHAESHVNQRPGVSFVHGDATRLPFPDDSFDVVTMFDLLEHVEDDHAAAAEAMRVVRPGGHILVSSPNERWHSPYHRVMGPISPTDEDMMQRWGHVRRGYTIAELAGLFGVLPDVRADFINRLTVIGHDVGFSRLPERPRRAALTVLAPLTWAGYWLQPRGARGTETAAGWRRRA